MEHTTELTFILFLVGVGYMVEKGFWPLWFGICAVALLLLAGCSYDLGL